jgi:hypothetical protein
MDPIQRRHLGGESPTFGLPQGCSSATDPKIARYGKIPGRRTRGISMRGVLWLLAIPVPVIIALYVFNVI